MIDNILNVTDQFVCVCVWTRFDSVPTKMHENSIAIGKFHIRTEQKRNCIFNELFEVDIFLLRYGLFYF